VTECGPRRFFRSRERRGDLRGGRHIGLRFELLATSLLASPLSSMPLVRFQPSAFARCPGFGNPVPDDHVVFVFPFDVDAVFLKAATEVREVADRASVI